MQIKFIVFWSASHRQIVVSKVAGYDSLLIRLGLSLNGIMLFAYLMFWKHSSELCNHLYYSYHLMAASDLWG